MNSLVVASASPFLASLISPETCDKIIIDGVTITQGCQLVELMYRGQIEPVSMQEADKLINVARNLQIRGLVASSRYFKQIIAYNKNYENLPYFTFP